MNKPIDFHKDIEVGDLIHNTHYGHWLVVTKLDRTSEVCHIVSIKGKINDHKYISENSCFGFHSKYAEYIVKLG